MVPLSVAILKDPQVEVAVCAPFDWDVETSQVLGGEEDAHRTEREGYQCYGKNANQEQKSPHDSLWWSGLTNRA